jgi:hypothetical protein
MKNWSRVPDGRLTPGRTDQLIVSRNVTSTSDTFATYTVEYVSALVR